MHLSAITWEIVTAKLCVTANNEFGCLGIIIMGLCFCVFLWIHLALFVLKYVRLCPFASMEMSCVCSNRWGFVCTRMCSSMAFSISLDVCVCVWFKVHTCCCRSSALRRASPLGWPQRKPALGSPPISQVPFQSGCYMGSRVSFKHDNPSSIIIVDRGTMWLFQH